MKCANWNFMAIKNGKQANGNQRYYCKRCRISFQERYSYGAYNKLTDKSIFQFLNEGLALEVSRVCCPFPKLRLSSA